MEQESKAGLKWGGSGQGGDGKEKDWAELHEHKPHLQAQGTGSHVSSQDRISTENSTVCPSKPRPPNRSVTHCN